MVRRRPRAPEADLRSERDAGMPGARRLLPTALAIVAAIQLGIPPADAVTRRVSRELRDRYEGRSVRLRIDLRAATHAADPNVVSREGIGYPRATAPVLFDELDTVYLDRIAREGRSRLNLTIYKSREAADRLRASAIPPPPGVNPNFAQTIATFAQRDSTSVILELTASKESPEKQVEEIEALLDRLFYMKAEPTIDELEEYVRRHPRLPISSLSARTGLNPDRIRALLGEIGPAADESR